MTRMRLPVLLLAAAAMVPLLSQAQTAPVLKSMTVTLPESTASFRRARARMSPTATVSPVTRSAWS